MTGVLQYFYPLFHLIEKVRFVFINFLGRTSDVAEKLLTYGLGRGVEYDDMPLVRSILRDAAGSKYKFSSLVLGIVKSPAFQMNMKMTDARTEQRAAR